MKNQFYSSNFVHTSSFVRSWLSYSICLLLVLASFGFRINSSQAASQTLRVLQYNTHHSGIGTDGKFDPVRFANAALAQNADLISLNEVEQFTGYGNQDNLDIYRRILNEKTGKNWKAFFFQRWGQANAPGSGDAILTTLDVVSTDRKNLGGGWVAGEATVNIGGHLINFFTTHFHHESASERLSQAIKVKDWISSYKGGISILAGDLNAGNSSSPEIKELKSILTDSWEQAKIDKTAISASDNPNGNTRNTRLDYIFYPKSQIGLNSVQVPDTRDSKKIMPSDHRPLLAVFSLNNNQNAPVPTPTPAPAPAPLPPAPAPVPLPIPLAEDIVIRAKDVLDANIHGNWVKTPDVTAANGIRLYNSDLKVSKLSEPKATPTDYFDVTFNAAANTPYHVWTRMKALNNDWTNDSVFVQFSDAVDKNGRRVAGISTSDAWKGFLEEGRGGGLSEWGWNDNDYDTLGQDVIFSKAGTHTMRIQIREDGVSLDQIVLSPAKYLKKAPGNLKNDATIVK